MEEKSSVMESLLERVEAYGETSFELFKLKAVDKTAEAVSTTASYSGVILSLFMFLVIISIGVGLWLGDLLGKTYYGFFCVAGFYGVLGVVLYLVKDTWIKKNVSNSIITHALS